MLFTANKMSKLGEKFNRFYRVAELMCKVSIVRPHWKIPSFKLRHGRRQ